MKMPSVYMKVHILNLAAKYNYYVSKAGFFFNLRMYKMA